MLSYALLIVFPLLLLLLLLDRQHHHHHHHHHLQQVLPPIWWCIAAIYIRFTYMHVLVYVVYYNINDVEMGIKEKGKAYSIMELAWFYWFRCVRGCSYEYMKAINDCLPIQACYYYIRVVFPVYIVPCRLFCVIIRGARGRSGGRRSILCTKRCGTGLKLSVDIYANQHRVRQSSHPLFFFSFFFFLFKDQSCLALYLSALKQPNISLINRATILFL